jgi:hypothetical protein
MSAVSRRRGRVHLDLEPGEAEALVSLASQVLELLGGETDAASSADSLEQLVGMSTAPVEPPDNEVLARLLPAAYQDDDAAAQEFRRLTDADLRAGKRAGLTRIVADVYAEGATADGASVVLDTESAKVWLYALTDVRLAFGTGIGVSEDMDDEREQLDPDSQRYAEIAIYDWLGYLQETLVMALAGD